MAFDINLLVSIKRAGFSILESPTEWTDKAGSKVVLGRSSLTMLLSVIRVRLIYWPWIYKSLRPLSPLETWLYKEKLRAQAIVRLEEINFCPRPSPGFSSPDGNHAQIANKTRLNPPSTFSTAIKLA